MAQLLILDVFGVLCAKLPLEEKTALPVLLQTKHYQVVSRPHLREFLAAAFSQYTVAIFSSSSYQNVSSVLEKLLSGRQQKSLIFLWTRDRTHLDPQGEHPYSTVKRLSDVLDNPVINSAGKYTWRNVLLCDDSTSKLTVNPPGSTLVCEPFTGAANDPHLSQLLGKIGASFAALARPISLLDTIPPELGKIIQQYSEHLQEQPFTSQEIEWLFQKRHSFCVTYFSEKYYEVSYYSTGLGRYVWGIKIMCELTVGVRQIEGIDERFVDYTFQGRYEKKRAELVSSLASDDSARDDTPKLTHNMLDLRSIFLLTRKRLRSVEKARQATLGLLQRIVDFFALDSISLELYLSGSVVNLELLNRPVKYSDAEHYVPITEELLATVRARCATYLMLLREAIAVMQ